MKKFAVLMTVLFVGISAQASHQCFVLAQSSQAPGTYDQVLANKEVVLDGGNPVILYSSADFTVSVMGVVGKNLQIASSSSASREVFALASTNGSSLQVLDSKNQTMILCSAK